MYQAFTALKVALSDNPVLIPYAPGAPTTVTTDASDFALGALQAQDRGNGFHPVPFESSKLSPAQLRHAMDMPAMPACRHACPAQGSHQQDPVEGLVAGLLYMGHACVQAPAQALP
jgi:hypothetical protein